MLHHWFTQRLPERAWNLVFECDWRPIRFMISIVFAGTAYIQLRFAFAPEMIAVASVVYVLAAISSVGFAAFYFFISVNDRAKHDPNTLPFRYLIELIAFTVWLFVFFQDCYCYAKGMLHFEETAWFHHVLENIIVLLTLLCGFGNALKLGKREEEGNG